MEKMVLKARAKINLGLDVLGQRADGYHEVSMIMQTVGIYDKLLMEKRRKPGIEIETNAGFLPVNENNLIYKAARLLMEEFQVQEGIYVYLNKFIPVAAGLAGGSSDAAAAMIGVNRLFDLGLSIRDLIGRGAAIGADVPYCLMRGTVLAEGIGEKLTRLPAMPKCLVVLAKPMVNVSTKVVYEKLNTVEAVKHPDIKAVQRGIRQGSLKVIAENMGNVLEAVTIPMVPVIAEIKETMRQNGALQAMMSGSGPTVFGLFEREEQAQSCLRALKKEGKAKHTYLTEIFNVF